MTITYTNQNNVSLTLRQRKPYFLQRVDGTGRVNQAVTTFKAPRQDGAFFISASLEMRNITLEGTVVGATVGQTYEARKQLLRVFTPKLKGTLVYRGVQISCVVEEAGFIAGGSARAPAFFISLLCPSPFFEALHDIRTEIALWSGRFSFPLEIPEAEGIELGVRTPSRIITVENDGDVACGCAIYFKASGTVSNPELLKTDTGEIMRINKTMIAGEVIAVFTHFANKQVLGSFNGEHLNYFNYMDTDSSFFQLEPGANTLRYTADVNADLLDVSVFFRPLYLGV